MKLVCYHQPGCGLIIPFRHEFEWKKEECFMIRKPDPPVIIAVTKDTPGRLSTASVQILDYNLNRFEINDRKGLEIVILTALLTFQDNIDTQRNVSSLPPSSIPPSKAPSPAPVLHTLSLSPADMPPPPPPKPAPKTGVDRIAEMQAMKGEYNEIIISDEGDVHDYAEYCNNLLQVCAADWLFATSFIQLFCSVRTMLCCSSLLNLLKPFKCLKSSK